MIEWYSNKKVGIFFDGVPNLGVRYTTPFMTSDETKSIKKYPFICRKNLEVILYDRQKDKTYNFTIPKGYCYDGASIPRLFWRIIGPNSDNRFLIPALVHDILCEHHNFVENDRSFSTNVFNALLEASGVNSFKRFLMKNSVATFQTLCCNWQ